MVENQGTDTPEAGDPACFLGDTCLSCGRVIEGHPDSNLCPHCGKPLDGRD